MVDAWPGSLPQRFWIDNFQGSLPETRIQFPNDTGPSQQRSRSTATPRVIAGKMMLTGAQLAIALDFIKTTLINGALPFNFPAQAEAGTWLVRFTNGQMPNYTAAGGDSYFLTMQIDVLP